MFTGIIESIGSIRALTPKGGDVRVHVETGKLDLSDVKLGDGFAADVSRETLDCTAMNDLKSGSPVNLEKALTPTTRLGGHLVSGHVDGVGEVVARTENARAVEFRIRAPKDLAKYIAHKGSITVDGTSLTVNAVDGAEFLLTIIPHTLSETIMASYQPGRRVNLEVDLLARYLERLLLGDKAAEPTSSNITESFLAANGYLKS
jgi:riboflavin synthase